MAEVVQVVVACGWWLAVWVVVLSATGTVGVLAAGGLVWWAARALLRSAIRATGPRRPLNASLSAELPARDPSPPEPAERRSEPQLRRPAWSKP